MGKFCYNIFELSPYYIVLMFAFSACQIQIRIILNNIKY